MAGGGSWSMAYITDLLTSTAEISNLVSVLTVLMGLVVMLVFLIRLIYQVGVTHYIIKTLSLLFACCRTLLMVEV